MHTESRQLPWPEQSPSHAFDTEQSSPRHAASHTHAPDAHEPWPEQSAGHDTG